MKHLIALALAYGLSLTTIATAATVTPEQAKQKVEQVCKTCHGADGNASAPGQGQYPRLAGQYHDYISRALHEYKSGERKNPIMAIYVKDLSEGEIDALARYFASMPSKLDDLSKYEQGD